LDIRYGRGAKTMICYVITFLFCQRENDTCHRDFITGAKIALQTGAKMAAFDEQIPAWI